ncbi:MAG: putative Class glutamine amidotransferase-like [Alphaproteobacteria bacterium]|nr:putative Class glutamine amidotransferase-like [Alphaproteobacteria bacterium]
MTILLYQDYVHNSGALYRVLRDIYGAGKIHYVDAADIIGGCLSTDIKAFFLPGGASRYVAAKLNGRGNELIRGYVAGGGLYIGMCAGAYYACRRTEWKKGTAEAICVDNELAFFPGVAAGPVPGFVREDGGTARNTALDPGGHAVLYTAGPLFYPDWEAEFQILARYADLPAGENAAVISGFFGKGRYVLISPNPAIDSTRLELMSFDVVDNAMAELTGLETRALLNTDYFIQLCREIID